MSLIPVGINNLRSGTFSYPPPPHVIIHHSNERISDEKILSVMKSALNSNNKIVLKDYQDDVCAGQVSNDLPDGDGKCNFKNGDIQIKQWQMGEKHGKIVIIYSLNGTPSDDKIRSIVDHVRSGNNQNVRNNYQGDLYTGRVYNDLPEGDGECIFKNGDIYTGHWRFGQMLGKGEMKYKDGSVYNGQWMLDQMSGEGEMKYSDGSKFTGYHINGNRIGLGIYEFNNKIKFIGNWILGNLLDIGSFKISGEKETNSKWKRDVYALPRNVYAPPEEGNRSELFVSQSIDDNENKLINEPSRLSKNDVDKIFKTLIKTEKYLNRLEPEIVVRMRKDPENGPPRTLLAEVGIGGDMDRPVPLNIYILCKSKKTVVNSNTGFTTSAPSESIIKDNKTECKTLKLAYHAITGEPFANLTRVCDWTSYHQRHFIEELTFYKKFVGERGFLTSGPRSVHYYTKQLGNNCEFKIGYLVPYIKDGNLSEFIGPQLDKFQRLSCFMDIASCLKTLEENEVVHGGISLTNFLVGRKTDGSITLMCSDFKISHNKKDVHFLHCGQDAYNSPERIYYLSQTNKEKEPPEVILNQCYGRDIWAAGICLLYLKGIHNNDLKARVKIFLSHMENLSKSKIDHRNNFNNFCEGISEQINTLFTAFEKEIGTSPELELVKSMMNVDPYQRPSAKKIFKTLSSLYVENYPINSLKGIYTGQVKNDLPHGQGKMTYADGSKYDGTWKNGHMHGEGKYFINDDVEYKSTWDQGIVTSIGSFTAIINGKFAPAPWEKNTCPLLLTNENPSISANKSQINKLTLTQLGLKDVDVNQITSNPEINNLCLSNRMVFRMQKRPSAGLSHSFLIVKEQPSEQDIYILCKIKINPNADIAEPTSTPATSAVGNGTKNFRLAYNVKTGETFIYLTRIADWTSFKQQDFLKELEYNKRLYQISGLPEEGPRAIHYYTKERKNKSGIDVKIGYLLPYSSEKCLYDHFNKPSAVQLNKK